MGAGKAYCATSRAANSWTNNEPDRLSGGEWNIAVLTYPDDICQNLCLWFKH